MTASPTPTPTAADLIFSPQANHNFSRILTDLKRANLSIGNRLRSIRDDASFVADVGAAFGRPLVANERCGSWYIDSAAKAASAYFKSTDGHTGEWRFSTRRLNLHLLRIIGQHDGCVVVDSTRRGKRMPDALSKTIPIWCCVLNRALFPDDVESHRLHTPPSAVSESENAQISARMPDAVASLVALGVDLEGLRAQLKKPLRPMWVTQESHLVPTEEVFADFHPVICCTSSRRVTGGEMSEGGYIQGAGDDTENWALGLTPPVFWQHQERLLSTPEAELPELVVELVEEYAQTAVGSAPKQLSPFVSVGPLSTEPAEDPATCIIRMLPQVTKSDTWINSPSQMDVGVGKHKLASRNLRVALPDICEFARKFFTTETDTAPDQYSAQEKRILILCESGKDLSVGVALALLCRHFDDDGSFVSRADVDAAAINKTTIKVKLGRIMTAFPEANPSRATLQSVNSFLMG